MSWFVLDASVTLAWCFPDEGSALSEKVAQMFRRGDTAVAPSFWPHEVLNALLVGEKRKRISIALTRSFLTDLVTLPVELQALPAEDLFNGIQDLCRSHGLTTYDAAYLHLAEASRMPLATLDRDLIAACKQSGVTLL